MNWKEKLKNTDKTKLLLSFALLVACGIIITEAVIIYAQNKVNKQIEEQSAKALKRFQQGDKTKLGESGGNYIKLQNVHFRWTNKIEVSIPKLTAKAVPINKSVFVNYDDLDSFVIKVYQGNVFIRPKVLEGMFNESVFNYPGSNLRGLKVNISPNKQMILSGNLNVILWIPFEMTTSLRVDQKTNTLVISVQKLRVFGFIPATKLIQFDPLNLDRLLKVPRNNHLMVRENQIMVKPFGLFPPPKITGDMESIEVQPEMLKLTFKSSNAPNFPSAPKEKNYIYLDDGNSKFGRFQMLDSQVRVLDAHSQDPFKFYLANYFNELPKSKIEFHKDSSVTVTFPDSNL